MGVLFDLIISADLENIGSIVPPPCPDLFLTLACLHCKSEHNGAVCIEPLNSNSAVDSATESVGPKRKTFPLLESSSGPTQPDLAVRCKTCNRDMRMRFSPRVFATYTAEVSPAPFVFASIDSRGAEILSWSPASIPWSAVSIASSPRPSARSTVFTDIDIGSSPDWCDFDEANSLPVTISNVRYTVKRK